MAAIIARAPSVERVEITPELHDEWLEWRKASIGASEVAAVLGLDPYTSPLELWGRKLGLIEPEPENDRFWLAHQHEATLAAWYTRQTGKAVAQSQVFLRHATMPISATLDGITDDGEVLEFKTVGERGSTARMLHGEGADVPHAWLLQCQVQALLAGVDQVQIVAMVGPHEVKTFTVDRDPELCESIASRLTQWWDSYVATNTPPPFEHAPPAIVHRIFGETGETFEATQQLEDARRLYDALTETIRLAKEQQDAIKEQVSADLRGRTAVFADGGSVKLVERQRAAYTVKAGSYVQLAWKKGKA